MDLNCCASNNRLFLFLCACVSGVLFALVWRKYEQTVQVSLVYHQNRYSPNLRDTRYDDWFLRQRERRIGEGEERLRYSAVREAARPQLESSYLFERVSVLCLVLARSRKAAEAVKHTWSQHCNVAAFFGEFDDDKVPVTKIPLVSSFGGFCHAFVRVWKKREVYDWLFVADDATFAIVENLRHYVAPLNSSALHYMGHPVNALSGSYNAASAGVLMSRGCAALLASVYADVHDCVAHKPPSWHFDQALGRILASYSVYPADTRDQGLRARFNPSSADSVLVPSSTHDFGSYWRTNFYPNEGASCCSDDAITLHGYSPPKMYLLEYLLHHLAVFRNSFEGLGNRPPALPLRRTAKRTKTKARLGEAHVQLISDSKRPHVKKEVANFVEDIFNSL